MIVTGTERVQPQLLAWDWCSQMSCELQNSARGFQMVCVELSQAEDQRMNQLFDVTFNFFFLNLEGNRLSLGSG